MSYSENAIVAFIIERWLILRMSDLSIIVLSIIALYIIAQWKILEKAGEEGWKALVPFYKTYMLFKISWHGKVYWFLLLSYILGIISLIFFMTILKNIRFMPYLILILIEIVPFIINIRLWVKLSKSFGLGIAFAIGLILFNSIFIMILAFGSSEYKRSIDNIETQKSCQ